MLGRSHRFAPLFALLLACSGRSLGGDEETSISTTQTSESSESGEPGSDCEPILQADGTPTGYEQCMTDVVVRVDPAICSDPYPPSRGCSAGYGVCSTDADCTDAPYGSCGYPADITGACSCEYGCLTDADCESGEVCLCAPIDEGTRCITAECMTDADCNPGYRCALSPGDGWTHLWPSLHCHSAADACQGDVDCPEGLCRWLDERWQCTG